MIDYIFVSSDSVTVPKPTRETPGKGSSKVKEGDLLCMATCRTPEAAVRYWQAKRTAAMAVAEEKTRDLGKAITIYCRPTPT